MLLNKSVRQIHSSYIVINTYHVHRTYSTTQVISTNEEGGVPRKKP